MNTSPGHFNALYLQMHGDAYLPRPNELYHLVVYDSTGYVITYQTGVCTGQEIIDHWDDRLTSASFQTRVDEFYQNILDARPSGQISPSPN